MPASMGQRRFHRYPIHLPLLHKPRAPAPTRAGVGWTRNLSEGGACVELAERLQPQLPFRVRLRTDRGAIEVEAQVVWAGEPGRAGGGVLHGVIFTQVSPEQHQALRDLVYRKGDRGHAGVRLPFEVSVTCQRKGQPGLPLQGWTGDISPGGLLLRLPQGLSPGTLLELTLYTPNGPLTVGGTVVWAEPSQRRTPEEPIRHGLRFTSLGWSASLSLGLLLTVLP
jgi:hypothetical protein